MGNMIKMQCENCGFSRELLVGSGFTSHNMNVIRKVFGEEILQDFMKELEEGRIRSYFMSLETAYCDSCKTIQSVDVLHYQYKGGNEIVKEIVGTCPECNGAVEFSDKRWICPDCGRKLKQFEVGCWD